MLPVPFKSRFCAVIEIPVEEFVDSIEFRSTGCRCFGICINTENFLNASFLLRPRLWCFPVIVTHQTLRSSRNHGFGCRAIFEPSRSKKRQLQSRRVFVHTWRRTLWAIAWMVRKRVATEKFCTLNKNWDRSKTKKALFSREKQGFLIATLTGLEPATTGSTVQYSNQLSYSAIVVWSFLPRNVSDVHVRN